MYIRHMKIESQREIDNAEGALKLSAAEHGIGHQKTAVCLDTLALILRKHKVRLLYAANMTARAEVI